MHVDAYPDIYQRISIETAANLLIPKIYDSNVIFRLVENESKGIGYYYAEIRRIEETDLLKAFRYIYLAEIMVSPDSRRSGIGKTLLEDLIRIAREEKIDRIDLDVSGFNAEALSFFRRQGFELLRRRLINKIST
jgi:ribosomal protein S18 acetylase RimI-like enzyme